MATESVVLEVSIDESNLGGENGEIYVFEWLSRTHRALQQTATDELKTSQEKLVATLVSVVSSSTPYPAPGGPLRSLVAQCLQTLYTRGETKSLFDTLQSFLKVAGDPKAQDANRIAVIYCVGELMRVFGAQVMSLVSDITLVSLKLNKSANSILLRYHGLMALEHTIYAAKRALTDALARDVIKQMRQAIGDKALPIVRVATKVLALMFPAGDGSRTPAEIESIVALCVKNLDNADHPTRIALAKLAAHVLVSSQVERIVVTTDSKKNKKGEGEEEDDGTVAVVPSSNEDPKLIMAPSEMLSQLSLHFNKPQSSLRTRVGIFSFYLALLAMLGSSFVERHYGLITDHFMTEIVSNPRNTGSRHETLIVRSLVGLVLRELVGERMLGEQTQISAIQELSSAYLKRWPAMLSGQTAPNPLVLVAALREVSGLLQQLGNAPVPVQEALVDPLVTLLSHPNHTVRVHASWALRCFCYSTPLRLPKALLNLVEMLQHDISQLSSPAAPLDIPLRALGHAYGLSSLLALIPHRPLYVSYDVTANVFHNSVQLLKRAGDHDVHVARVEVEIAWTTIASLATLGPNFVRAHLPQLLVLWRNALPKPTSKDSSSGRAPMEWKFLLHVRESALRAVYQFLRHNSTLITPDVARRIASLLSNALQFANIFLSQKIEEVLDVDSSKKDQGLSLSGTEALLRCRIFQAFSLLEPSAVSDATQVSLLESTIGLLAGFDGYQGSSVQAAIASSSGTFTSIWNSVDGYAYGVTNIQVGEGSSASDGLNRDPNEAVVDELARRPIIRSLEHDPLALCEVQHGGPGLLQSEPPNAFTASVNAAIELFSRLLPVQDSNSMSKVVSKLLEAIGSPRLERNPGRKAAVVLNGTVALALALRPTQSHSRQNADGFANPQVSAVITGFLKGGLVDGDVALRRASSEAVGRLASLAGTNFLTTQIKTLVNEVVGNRDPHGRAGCALAFGAIYGFVGSVAAGPLLKTTVHVLMSLINDPHPVVHYWALKSLARVIDAASLAYASYVPSTLGLLFKVYMSDSHEPEGGSLNYANIGGDLPTYQAICQAIDAVVTVVGPDIHESTRTRTLILDLIHQFLESDEDEGICIEAIRCMQHILMFAPSHVDIPKLVIRFRGYLSSSRRPLKVASINALYQLVQKDALLMSRLGGDQLVEQLFGMLDDDSSVDGVRSVIQTWLQHTVVHNPSAWIDLCQRIMSRTTASQQIADAAKRKDFADDEGQSLSQGPDAPATSRPVARWRTQLFALQCLHIICQTVWRSGRREHLDLVFARQHNFPLSALLVSRVADLIKIAFTASAAQVMEIRLEGLYVLQDVIEIFAAAPDPDYDNASLLEQYQAPIAAALTPAFSADSTPEILASAIEASAVFVGSGVVKDASRMGRILKMLVSALEQCQDATMFRLGDAAELSPNASVMLRIATLAAWAKLKSANTNKAFLSDVLSPHLPTLAVLWISTLRDHAAAKAGTEAFDDGSGGLDTSYSTLGREILIPFYVEAWPSILDAVTVAMEEQNPWIQAAMNGKKSLDTNTKTYPQHTATFFFVIFGLVYEALASSKPDSHHAKGGVAVVALRALACLVHPKYSGDLFTDPIIFEETMHLLYRLALTEASVAQVHLIEVTASLSRALQSTTRPASEPQSRLTSIAHCFKIVAYILKRLLSHSHDQSTSKCSPAEKVKLLNAGFSAFYEMLEGYGDSQRSDLYLLGLFLYHELLRDETPDDVVGPTLQSLKAFIERPASKDVEKTETIVHCLLSACLSNIDAMRGRSGPTCTRKISNNLLAVSLIVTVVPPSVRLGQAVIEHCCFLISQHLQLIDEDVSLTAAHCGKTLIVAAMSGNIILHQSIKLLLPGIVGCVAAIAASEKQEQQLQHYTLLVAELWKTLGHVFSHVPPVQHANVLSVALPTMILLLNPGYPSLHSVTIAQLLSFAASDPDAFKEVTGSLHSEMAKNLEDSMKQAIGGAKQPGSGTAKPQISLKSFK